MFPSINQIKEALGFGPDRVETGDSVRLKNPTQQQVDEILNQDIPKDYKGTLTGVTNHEAKPIRSMFGPQYECCVSTLFTIHHPDGNEQIRSKTVTWPAEIAKDENGKKIHKCSLK